MKRFWTRVIGAGLLAMGGVCLGEMTREDALRGGLVIKSQDAVAFVPVVAETTRVDWVSSPLVVDGVLSDWEMAGVEPIWVEGSEHVTWYGGDYRGGEDLRLAMRYARDDTFLYAAFEVEDDEAPHPWKVELGIAPGNSPLITQWRDVGRRYGADDVHVVLTLGENGTASLRWIHVQGRMEQELVSNAFGNDAERREFIEKELTSSPAEAKIFSSHAHVQRGAKWVTTVEVAFPWRLLLPYSPVRYETLKFNVAISDRDSAGKHGDIGWMPGLLGTYSAAHFATLEFVPPPGRTGIDSFAHLGKYHYVNEKVPVSFMGYNHGEKDVRGVLEIVDAEAPEGSPALASLEMVFPAKKTAWRHAEFHSESVEKSSLKLRARLTLHDGTEYWVPVHVPAREDRVQIQSAKPLLAAIGKVQAQAEVLSNLCVRVAQKGLDTTYPMAYWTLQQMFVARGYEDIQKGNSQRVLDNAAYLETLFIEHKAHVEAMLCDRDVARAFAMPRRVLPERLTIRDGYYHDGKKPIFLWGPCVFWWMRSVQADTWRLGFNSASPEVPLEKPSEHAAIGEYLEAYRTHGVLMNMQVGSWSFDELKRAHPEVANVDPNNFLSVQIQHPLVREEIRKRIDTTIAFLKSFQGVRSYFLWNEPDYNNYSEMVRQDFVAKMKEKVGSLEALNARWKSAWATWDSVSLPRGYTPELQAARVDFVEYQNAQLEDFFGFLHKTARAADPTRPTHVKYMCMTADRLDIEQLQALAQLCGNDGNCGRRDIVFVDLCRSLYPEKPVVNTEVHIWYRDYATVVRVPWILALHGVADANWWCWHGNERFSDSVANAQSMHALALGGLDIRRLFDPYIHALATRPQAIATLYPDVYAGRSGRALERFRYQIGAAESAVDLRTLFVSEKQVASGELRKHKIVLALESDTVRDDTWNALCKWVQAGGILVVNANGFAQNERGEPRDTSALLLKEGGTRWRDDVRKIAIGKGAVYCVESAISQNAHDARQALYAEIFARLVSESGLAASGIRILPKNGDYTGLHNWDIRTVSVKGGVVLCMVPGDWSLDGKVIPELVLKTVRPIRKITNLITQQEVARADFAIHPREPALYFVEF